jgi:hypothetical protein
VFANVMVLVVAVIVVDLTAEITQMENTEAPVVEEPAVVEAPVVEEPAVVEAVVTPAAE